MFEKLSMWCHKVIPLVYDDALSYYEAICKVVAKVNELVQGVNDVTETAVFSVNGKKPESGNVTVGTVTSVDGKEPDSDGKVVVGAVTSVNSVKPDDNGNVKAGTVRSVNGSTPDEEGNVNLPTVSGVTSVDGVGADSEGNVPLNAVKKVNDIAPDSAGNVNVGTVKSVNSVSPDSTGNVNVGTVKSVNSVSPDSTGNVNVGTVKSVNSVSPDSAGNVNISAYNVGALADNPFKETVLTYNASNFNATYGEPKLRQLGRFTTLAWYCECIKELNQGETILTGLPDTNVHVTAFSICTKTDGSQLITPLQLYNVEGEIRLVPRWVGYGIPVGQVVIYVVYLSY